MTGPGYLEVEVVVTVNWWTWETWVEMVWDVLGEVVVALLVLLVVPGVV